ncbi:MAG TPA: pyridoxamine 5'-phosphate oxidase family protein [Ramlibacter sp.]|nr:pyridoxamine 5'-phosphate oxidase family protein [Ramlibacter sp.]
MNASSQPSALRALLESQPVAALATLHQGEPAVSMVPYALLPQGQGFVIHVSRLATHTADMLAHTAVALLVTAPPGSSDSPQELARASIRGPAAQIASDSARYLEARNCYLAKFPQTEELFTFADFSLFLIQARSVRFVGGFAQASTVSAEEFVRLMGGS